MRQRVALFTMVGLLAVLGFILFGVESTLPERVATHFGANGVPNGWTPRESFVWTMAVIVVVPVVVLQGIGLALGSIPTSLINLPNRDYWLAPERRDETIGRVRTAMLEFGNATFAFLLFVVWSIIDANKGGEAHLGSYFPFVVALFLAFVAGWTIVLVKPYLKVPETA